MYKVIFLLLIVLVTGFSLALAVQSKEIKLNAPVLAGSPILVLNR